MMVAVFTIDNGTFIDVVFSLAVDTGAVVDVVFSFVVVSGAFVDVVFSFAVETGGFVDNDDILDFKGYSFEVVVGKFCPDGTKFLFNFGKTVAKIRSGFAKIRYVGAKIRYNVAKIEYGWCQNPLRVC